MDDEWVWNWEGGLALGAGSWECSLQFGVWSLELMVLLVGGGELVVDRRMGTKSSELASGLLIWFMSGRGIELRYCIHTHTYSHNTNQASEILSTDLA